MLAISPGSILLLINIFIIVLINNSEIKIIGKALERFIYISLPYVSKRDVEINIVETNTPNIMHCIISIHVNLKYVITYINPHVAIQNGSNIIFFSFPRYLCALLIP